MRAGSHSRRPQAAGQGQQEPGGRLGGRPRNGGQQVGGKGLTEGAVAWDEGGA